MHRVVAAGRRGTGGEKRTGYALQEGDQRWKQGVWPDQRCKRARGERAHGVVALECAPRHVWHKGVGGERVVHVTALRQERQRAQFAIKCKASKLQVSRTRRVTIRLPGSGWECSLKGQLKRAACGKEGGGATCTEGRRRESSMSTGCSEGCRLLGCGGKLVQQEGVQGRVAMKEVGAGGGAARGSGVAHIHEAHHSRQQRRKRQRCR
eukprot:7154535-Pyramimonas_sp.AAC.1